MQDVTIPYIANACGNDRVVVFDEFVQPYGYNMV